MMKAENLQFLDYQNNLFEQFFKQNTFRICYRWFQLDTLELLKCWLDQIIWGLETYRNKYEKHKEKEEKMCSTYVRLYVEFVVHFMSWFLLEWMNHSWMKKIVVIPVVVQCFKHLVTQAICLGANFL